MKEPDAPRSASAEEEARIAETPAVFANKVFVSPQPGGAKIAFAEARRASCENLASPRVAVFPQHADLAVLRRRSTGPPAPPLGGIRLPGSPLFIHRSSSRGPLRRDRVACRFVPRDIRHPVSSRAPPMGS